MASYSKKKNQNDLLLVGGNRGIVASDEVKRLANAIITVHSKYGGVRLQCIGAAAVNKATKAFIFARRILKAEGCELCMTADFVTVETDGVKKVGIVYYVSTR